jgi:hypothetical protein
MVKIEDPAIFDRDAKDEFDNPLPQKHLLSKGQRTYQLHEWRRKDKVHPFCEEDVDMAP